jgi:hypothetical protein
VSLRFEEGQLGVKHILTQIYLEFDIYSENSRHL